jgi:ribonuclease Y
MDTTLIISLITGLVALAAGTFAGKVIFAKNTAQKVEEAEQQARKIISDAKSNAENIKKERILEAKEKFVQLKAEHDRELNEKNRKIADSEGRIKQKEQTINQKLETI